MDARHTGTQLNSGTEMCLGQVRRCNERSQMKAGDEVEDMSFTDKLPGGGSFTAW